MRPHDLERLVAVLSSARDRATEIAGRAPIGVRLVEPDPDHHWYLCAFVGDAFLCLRPELDPETVPRRVHAAAACALLVEQVESLIDAGELQVIVSLADRLGGALDEPGLNEILDGVAASASTLGVWREAPARAIASLPQIEVGVRLHDAFRAAWDRFVAETEPLVARQDTLPDATVDVLRDIEQAAARVCAHRAIATEIAETMTSNDVGAAQIVARHITPLDPGS